MLDPSIYYSDFYWNDLKIVEDHLNRLISGKNDVDYIENFRHKSLKKFKKALVLNCGNGHVEREFISRNVVDSAIGIDISEDLINQAELNKGDKAIDYIVCDINLFDFDSIDFDLLIVFAAGHHIKCLNKVFAATRKKLLQNNGMIVGFDYIGAHRNQYDYEVWEKINHYNKKLPVYLQNELTYPHLPTMLETDPSEAIHSELLEEVLKKYFNLNITMLGGGIAYEILSHNDKLRKIIDKNENIEIINNFVKSVLDWDIKESKKDNRFNFFTSFYGNPIKNLDEDKISRDIEDEYLYENKFPLGKSYYPNTFLQDLTEELSNKSIEVVHKQKYIDECHRKIDKLSREAEEYSKKEKIFSELSLKKFLKTYIKKKIHNKFKKFIPYKFFKFKLIRFFKKPENKNID